MKSDNHLTSITVPEDFEEPEQLDWETHNGVAGLLELLNEAEPRTMLLVIRLVESGKGSLRLDTELSVYGEPLSYRLLLYVKGAREPWELAVSGRRQKGVGRQWWITLGTTWETGQARH